MKLASIRWDLSESDLESIEAIVDRAVHLYDAYDLPDDRLAITMDLTACHLNGNRLDLERLLKADHSNFAHDILGIRKHIDRKTGKLLDCFVPRFTAKNYTICKGCGVEIKKGGRFHGCCSSQCVRDAYC